MKPEQMLNSIGLVTQVEQLIKNNEEMRNVNETLKEMSKRDFVEITTDVFDDIFQGSPVKRTQFNGFVRNLDFLKK